MPICRFTHFAHFSKFSNLCANVHFGEHHIFLRISHKNLIWPHFPILADKFFSLISSYFLLFLKTIINFLVVTKNVITLIIVFACFYEICEFGAFADLSDNHDLLLKMRIFKFCQLWAQLSVCSI